MSSSECVIKTDGKTLHYTLEKLLGEGTSSKVMEATDESGKKVALKICKNKEIVKYGIQISFLAEIDVLKRVRHPNIINPHYIAFNKSKIVHASDIAIDSLDRYITNNALGQKDRLSIVYQLFSALDYLHSNSILHRDVKPQNILVYDVGSEDIASTEIRLIDFGLAHVDFSSTSPKYNPENQIFVTILWRPPEFIEFEILCEETKNPVKESDYLIYGEEVDIWSAGVTAANIFTGNNYLTRLDPKTLSPKSILKAISEVLGPLTPSQEKCLASYDFSKEISSKGLGASKYRASNALDMRALPDEIVSFLRWIANPKPKLRPTAKQVLQHQLFADHEYVKPPKIKYSELNPKAKLNNLIDVEKIKSWMAEIIDLDISYISEYTSGTNMHRVAMDVFLRYCGKIFIPEEQAPLVAWTCLHMAYKLYFIDPDICKIVDSVPSDMQEKELKTHIFDLEKMILIKLGYILFRKN
jgi:serine/threonine protein kinase